MGGVTLTFHRMFQLSLTSEHGDHQDKLRNWVIMLSAGRYHSSSDAVCLRITHRWMAKESTVLTVKLSCALIADFESGSGGVDSVVEHPLSRDIESNLLLILDWAHRG